MGSGGYWGAGLSTVVGCVVESGRGDPSPWSGKASAAREEAGANDKLEGRRTHANGNLTAGSAGKKKTREIKKN